MPASTLDPVNSALRTSLSKINSENSLESQLAGSTKKALLSNIEFESAGGLQLDKLKSKYIVLKSSTTPQASKPEEDMNSDEKLKLAKYELFPLESVQLGWSNYDWSVGCGMINMGNTCYLNSTIQALFHVPALVNWLMSDMEHTECQESGIMCVICVMRKTLQESQQCNGNSIRPSLIYSKLRLICRNFIMGRQEDAHEFLRYLVEAMEKAYLSRFRNHTELDARVKETTPLNQILGGYLRSAVHCLVCGHVSTTFQHFQDLLLDIRKSQNVDEALDGYFSREKLDDESYQCESCKKHVPATKQFSLERAPMVLCIQLKRFSISNTKISKHVSFRQRLDLTKFARHRPSVPLIYRLVALITHMGPTVNCGHYTAVALAPTGHYYQFDDSMVRPISHQGVFNTNAYIMMYELESSPFPQKGTNNGKSKLHQQAESKPTCAASTSSSTSNERCSPIVLNANTASANPKPTQNGIGFTSSKVYGPELPPEKPVEKSNSSTKFNGNYTTEQSTGSGSRSTSTTETDNESSKRENSKPTLSTKSPTTPSSNNLNKSKTSEPTLTPKTHQSRSVSTSPKENSNTTNGTIKAPDQYKKDKEKVESVAKKLVPYESDDSSNSEDSKLTETTSKLNETRTKTPETRPKSSEPRPKVVEPRPKSTERVPNSTEPKIVDPISDEGTTTVATGVSSSGEWKVTSTTDCSLSTTKCNWQRGSGGGSASGGGKGNCNSNTVNELFKMSHSGYSAPIASWNGTRSHLDKEVSNERREERKRALNDADPDDQGRAKHVKSQNNNNNNHFKSNPGYNPVQEYHNARNWGQKNGSRYYANSGVYGNKHRRNFNHKNNFHNKNNYRFKQS